MAEAGLYFYEDGVRVDIKNTETAQHFFRQLCDKYKPGDLIDTDSRDHVLLCWLIEGHPHRDELCPDGVDMFCIHRNSDIGYLGDATGFSVIATGSNNRPVPFNINKALRGMESTLEEQIRTAFRHAIEYQVSHWRKQVFRDGLRCPVFGDLLTRANTHVDHDPPFEVLVEQFFVTEKLQLKDVSMSDPDNIWLPEEPVLSAWRAYHWTNMRLQLVSIAGHYELGRRRREQEKSASVFGGLRA